MLVLIPLSCLTFSNISMTPCQFSTRSVNLQICSISIYAGRTLNLTPITMSSMCLLSSTHFTSAMQSPLNLLTTTRPCLTPCLKAQSSRLMIVRWTSSTHPSTRACRKMMTWMVLEASANERVTRGSSDHAYTAQRTQHLDALCADCHAHGCITIHHIGHRSQEFNRFRLSVQAPAALRNHSSMEQPCHLCRSLAVLAAVFPTRPSALQALLPPTSSSVSCAACGREESVCVRERV